MNSVRLVCSAQSHSPNFEDKLSPRCGERKKTPSVAIITTAEVPSGCVPMATQIEVRHVDVISDAYRGFAYRGSPTLCANFPYAELYTSFSARPNGVFFPTFCRWT